MIEIVMQRTSICTPTLLCLDWRHYLTKKDFREKVFIPRDPTGIMIIFNLAHSSRPMTMSSMPIFGRELSLLKSLDNYISWYTHVFRTVRQAGMGIR